MQLTQLYTIGEGWGEDFPSNAFLVRSIPIVRQSVWEWIRLDYGMMLQWLKSHCKIPLAYIFAGLFYMSGYTDSWVTGCETQLCPCMQQTAGNIMHTACLITYLSSGIPTGSWSLLYRTSSAGRKNPPTGLLIWISAPCIFALLLDLQPWGLSQVYFTILQFTVDRCP